MGLKNYLFKKWMLLFILSFIGLGGVFFYVDIYREKTLNVDLHGVVDDEKALEGWSAFSPKSNSFSVYFPDSPKENSRELSIPGSRNTLLYQEFYLKTDDDYHFSVSHATLPAQWLKFGSNLVLKGSLKVILKELGHVSLVGKSSNTFKTYPSLDYEHYFQDRETSGTLILVKDTLYKVEVTYPLSQRLEAQKRLVPFIQSFQPLKQQQNNQETTELTENTKPVESPPTESAKNIDSKNSIELTESPEPEKAAKTNRSYSIR